MTPMITEKIFTGIGLIAMIAVAIPIFLFLCVIAGWSIFWIFEISFDFMGKVGDSLPWPE